VLILPFEHDNPVNSRTFGGADDRAEIARVGDLVEDEQEQRCFSGRA
jgi:hypothetical protein